jgi:hypothetical protein
MNSITKIFLQEFNELAEQVGKSDMALCAEHTLADLCKKEAELSAIRAKMLRSISQIDIALRLYRATSEAANYRIGGDADATGVLFPPVNSVSGSVIIGSKTPVKRNVRAKKASALSESSADLSPAQPATEN